MTDTTRIVVLGGGYGGVQAAKLLNAKLGKRRDIEITLIDKNPFQTLMTELHEVACGRVEPESVLITYRKIFGVTRVAVVADRIRTIDFEARKLVSDAASYDYDYLLIGVGAEPEDFGLPGVRQNAFMLWSFEDALRLRPHIEDVFRQAASEKDARKRAELLTFVVAGAGFTGIEVAGELKDHRKVMCQAYHIDESEVRIIVVEALGWILPNLPPRLQEKARRYLERRGVEIMLRSPIVGAEDGKVLLAGNASIPTRTFIWTCGIQGREFAGNLALTKGRCVNRACRFSATQSTCGVKNCTFSPDQYVVGKRGRLLVNEYMQSVDYSNVYVVGDVSWYLEGGKVLPQIVETAVQTGETAAHNIVADIEHGQMKAFHSSYHGIMVSLGAFSGVAHVMGISLTGIFAIGVKHMINIVHLFTVAGVNQVWEYVKHEFLDVKNQRSFIGGLAAYKVRGYWPLLLRVWLGFMWVVEATNKMTEGWLDFCTGQSKTGWMFSPGVIQAGVKGAEAGSAAPSGAQAGAAVAQAGAAGLRPQRRVRLPPRQPAPRRRLPDRRRLPRPALPPCRAPRPQQGPHPTPPLPPPVPLPRQAASRPQRLLPPAPRRLPPRQPAPRRRLPDRRRLPRPVLLQCRVPRLQQGPHPTPPLPPPALPPPALPPRRPRLLPRRLMPWPRPMPSRGPGWTLRTTSWIRPPAS